MKRNPVVAIWVLGLVVTVIAYQLGPNHFLSSVVAFFGDVGQVIENWVWELSHASLQFVRAAAIGLYVVFVALSLLVIREGGRARTALVVVSIAFFLLIGSGEFYVSNDRWFAAFALCAVGALIMTRRLAGGGRMVPRP